jgi:hypothetical protein
MASYVGDVWWVRLLIQRGLAAIYFVAFLCAFFQFRALLGDRGLQPTRAFLRRTTFLEAPSLFHAYYSDRFAAAVAALGASVSAVVLVGASEAGPPWLSLGVWLLLWALYLTFVNVGQRFYAFGWESLLVEAGFFASFLGPADSAPSVVPIVLLRWLLFRVEFGAGLIKLRHDRCWRDLTCLYYHYETQPLPGPLSWYFHRMPRALHRFGVLFSHFVQVAVPFGLFAPQPVASVAGTLTILHQLWLVVSGNYAWLNWLTLVLGIASLSDASLSRFMGHAPWGLLPRSELTDIVLWLLAGITIALSVRPIINLMSREQAMNLNYNPLHLVNTYGAFGSVTRKRFEVVLAGTEEVAVTPETIWREYELKGKPGAVERRPPQIAPYHLRLDWLLWFLPFSTVASDDGVFQVSHERWFLRLVQRLLEADRATLRLLRSDPFAGRRPSFVCARYYRYRYSEPAEKRRTGAWWHRELIGDYLEPVSLPEIERSLGVSQSRSSSSSAGERGSSKAHASSRRR